MERTRNKATHTTIGDLPENLIQTILECLPIEDAVKTSALARRWRYKWTTISKLAFDNQFAYYLQDKSLSESDFVRIIANILLLHRGSTIHSFNLVIPDDYATVGPAYIHNWMHCISRKGVKEFSLEFWDCPPEGFYKLPSHLYSNMNLTHLEVTRCVLNLPSGFRGFPKLISLELCGVTLEKRSFGCFISSCPLLESLFLDTWFGSDHLNICSPSLTRLGIEGESRDGLQSIYVNAENLRSIWLNGRFRTHLAEMNSNSSVNYNTIEELGRLPKIEVIHIGLDNFESITADGAPRRLPTPLVHLKNIMIESIDFADPAQGISALCLIRSAPNLQDLDFKAKCTTDVEQTSSFPTEDWALNHLQRVSIGSLRGSRPELEFIKSLLASSPSLKSMIIELHPAVDDKAGSLISLELLKFCRASPRAEVHFRNYPKYKYFVYAENGRSVCC